MEADHPLIKEIAAAEEVLWANPLLETTTGRRISTTLGLADIEEAEKRLQRFAPYLAKVFPETRPNNGLIESRLTPIPLMKKKLEDRFGQSLAGSLYLKCDSHLPIAGSVKARGGIYEVLKTAEEIAVQNGLLPAEEGADNYLLFDSEKARAILSRYSIVVGSTGNLGLSIGIMSAQLGFRVVVHMSAEARQWKKDLLREKGAIVVEHTGDYGQAVEQGRRESAGDPCSHFVDDENSSALFLGYAVAAGRLQAQLKAAGLKVDEDHPLFVYIPCGVGGAPGGITFGLRTIFGDSAHCFFAEPTHSPAMLLGLLTRRHNAVSVYDFGLDNVTGADGLAVGRPSGFVGKTLEKDISGVFTVNDNHLYELLKDLADAENILVEPSAAAGFPGPWQLMSSAAGRRYLAERTGPARLEKATHLVWATGGSMVPAEIMRSFYAKGERAD